MIIRSSKLAAQMAQDQGVGRKTLNDKALKKACSEFEGLMMNMILKGMRRTINRSGLIDGGQGEKIFQDMYDQEITNQASMSGGMGLGQMLYEQLTNSSAGSGSNGRTMGRNLSAADYIKSMNRTRPVETDRTEVRSDDFVPEAAVPAVSEPTEASAGSSVGPAAAQPRTTGLTWPVDGQVSSGFGQRLHPILGQVREHHGLDIAAGEGEAFQATAAGRVTFAGWTEGYGNLIEIDHGNGLVSRYGHNQENLVVVGQKVSAGQTIGRVGNTGLSTGPHLHFEIRDQGLAVDPMARLTGPNNATAAAAVKVSSKTARSG